MSLDRDPDAVARCQELREREGVNDKACWHRLEASVPDARQRPVSVSPKERGLIR
jgi:hypothetical protein